MFIAESSWINCSGKFAARRKEGQKYRNVECCRTGKRSAALRAAWNDR